MSAIEILRKHEDTIKGKYHVRKIDLFGSFARGEQRENSDIDVFVEFEKGSKTFDNYMDLKFFLEEMKSLERLVQNLVR